MKIINDLCTMIWINLKYMITNRLAVVVTVCFSTIFLILSMTLLKEYETKSSLPIGVVDKDQTEMSKQTIVRLQDISGVLVMSLGEEELEQALKEERILAGFVISEGYEEAIKSNRPMGSVKMLYLKDYEYISIVSDIFAKSMISDICLYRGQYLIENIGKKEGLGSFSDYLEYTSSMKLEKDYEFSFDFSYYKIGEGGNESTNKVENTLLSNQLFLGLVTIFLSFLLMFLCFCLRRDKQVSRRLRINLIHNVVIEVASIVTMLLVSSVLITLLTGYICKFLRFSQVSHWISVWGCLGVFSIIYLLFFFLLSKISKSDIVYQFVGMFFVLVFGGLSIMGAIGQLGVFKIFEFVKNIPNYWFIKAITDIILEGNTKISLLVLVLGGLLGGVYSIITYMKYRRIVR